ncbi:hypothetical protein [Corynebacterium ulceribovis]|uniref:hypothetical protein n=1 Tax=Corynebacterium ulceribovis TaxID=487732 RepID=UPI00036855CE|nr:hypothetical protein [Corynebacterium ulceribovis]
MSNTSSNRPLPPEVYRRRRIAALVIVIVLILFVAWLTKTIVSAVGSNDAAETSEMTTSQSEGSGDATTSPSEKPEESKEPKPSESTSTKASESEEAKAKKTCELADLEIVASSDRVTFGPGVQPKLYITVKNPTQADCEIDLDENQLRFEVFSLANNQRVWSDVDCHESVGVGQETFEAGKEKSYEAVWSRRTSEPDKCTAAERPEAKPGPYFLHGLIGENASEAHTFNLG